MNISELKITRELSAIELDQVGGGGCGCGSNGKCITKQSDGTQTNCAGMPLYGGAPVK